MRPAFLHPRRTPVFLVALFTLLFGVLATAPAQAGTIRPSALGNCGSYANSNDRVCLIAWGGPAVPRIGFVALHVFTGSDGHDHAYGEDYSAKYVTIFLEISHDGGHTWNGWQDPSQMTWADWADNGTVAVYDGPGTWVRACAYDWNNHYVCTGWN